MTSDGWTPEKDAQRKQLNREYAKLKRDPNRKRRFSPKKYSATNTQQETEART